MPMILSMQFYTCFSFLSILCVSLFTTAVTSLVSSCSMQKRIHQPVALSIHLPSFTNRKGNSFSSAAPHPGVGYSLT